MPTVLLRKQCTRSVVGHKAHRPLPCPVSSGVYKCKSAPSQLEAITHTSAPTQYWRTSTKTVMPEMIPSQVATDICGIERLSSSLTKLFSELHSEQVTTRLFSKTSGHRTVYSFVHVNTSATMPVL